MFESVIGFITDNLSFSEKSEKIFTKLQSIQLTQHVNPIWHSSLALFSALLGLSSLMSKRLHFTLPVLVLLQKDFNNTKHSATLSYFSTAEIQDVILWEGNLQFSVNVLNTMLKCNTK